MNLFFTKRKEEQMTFEEYMIEGIRKYMAERFFIEGENEDFYFGKSLLNDYTTVFYNPDICSHSEIFHCIKKVYDDLCWNNNIGTYDLESLDLSGSAFRIHASCRKYIYYNKNDEASKYVFGINYMEKGVLEEAIKKNPKRWELYKKMNQN